MDPRNIDGYNFPGFTLEQVQLANIQTYNEQACSSLENIQQIRNLGNVAADNDRYNKADSGEGSKMIQDCFKNTVPQPFPGSMLVVPDSLQHHYRPIPIGHPMMNQLVSSQAPNQLLNDDRIELNMEPDILLNKINMKILNKQNTEQNSNFTFPNPVYIGTLDGRNNSMCNPSSLFEYQIPMQTSLGGSELNSNSLNTRLMNNLRPLNENMYKGQENMLMIQHVNAQTDCLNVFSGPVLNNFQLQNYQNLMQTIFPMDSSRLIQEFNMPINDIVSGHSDQLWSREPPGHQFSSEGFSQQLCQDSNYLKKQTDFGNNSLKQQSFDFPQQQNISVSVINNFRECVAPSIDSRKQTINKSSDSTLSLTFNEGKKDILNTDTYTEPFKGFEENSNISMDLPNSVNDEKATAIDAANQSKIISRNSPDNKTNFTDCDQHEVSATKEARLDAPNTQIHETNHKSNMTDEQLRELSPGVKTSNAQIQETNYQSISANEQSRELSPGLNTSNAETHETNCQSNAANEHLTKSSPGLNTSNIESDVHPCESDSCNEKSHNGDEERHNSSPQPPPLIPITQIILNELHQNKRVSTETRKTFLRSKLKDNVDETSKITENESTEIDKFVTQDIFSSFKVSDCQNIQENRTIQQSENASIPVISDSIFTKKRSINEDLNQENFKKRKRSSKKSKCKKMALNIDTAIDDNLTSGERRCENPNNTNSNDSEDQQLSEKEKVVNDAFTITTRIPCILNPPCLKNFRLQCPINTGTLNTTRNQTACKKININKENYDHQRSEKEIILRENITGGRKPFFLNPPCLKNYRSENKSADFRMTDPLFEVREMKAQQRKQEQLDDLNDRLKFMHSGIESLFEMFKESSKNIFQYL